MSALLGWFTGKQSDRRAYPRKKVVYRAAFATGEVPEGGQLTYKPAIGLDISGGGVLLLLPVKLGAPECELKFVLGTRTIKSRARVVWSKSADHQGKPAWLHGMRFVGISADDWDAVIRFVTGQSVEEINKAREEIEAVMLTPDDAARLIPKVLQDRLLEMLVASRRLAPIDPRIIPLVQYSYSGIIAQAGKNYHRLTIASRIKDLETNENTEFTTKFLFSEDGKDVKML